MIPSNIRFVDRGLYDRIQFLSEKYTLDDTKLELNLNTAVSLMKISDKNKTKVVDAMKKIEKYLLKKSNFNLVIRNIPRYGKSVSTGESVNVTHEALRDTINQFGDVKSLYIRYGVSFIEMTDNVYTHNTLNQMQIGQNIISTEVV